MKTFSMLGCGLVIAAALAMLDLSAFGRGGGGRGGGFGGGGARGGGGFSGGGARGGGFSGSRPSMGGAPSFSRPSAPASRPSGGYSRPSTPISRPSTGISRPSTLPASRAPVGGGSLAGRPSVGGPSAGLTPGSRPPIGSRPSQLPAGIDRPSGIDRPGSIDRPGGPVAGTLPAGRPGIDERPGGPASRPGISTLPAAGVGAGLGAVAGSRLPGRGERPAQLPGLGREDRWQQIRDNRPEWVADRHQDLQGRLENRHDTMRDWQDSRQDFLTDRREDWQNWLGDRYPWHDGWHHGYWHGAWGGYWEHMWEEHPVWAAFGVTNWMLNSVGYTYGLWDYSNPYYDYAPAGEVVYDYSQPIVAASEPATEGAAELPPGVSQTGLEVFDQARAAFEQGLYQEALNLSNEALKAMPNDAVIHEFRALCLFALGHVRPAAAVLHSVLAVGPGWDWTTLASLYPDTETYTKQLRQLEDFVRSNPAEADGRFVLAYHYMTMGHPDAAAWGGERLQILGRN